MPEALPLMTLRSPASVPPIVVLLAFERLIPPPEFARAFVPVTSVPIRFPWMTVPSDDSTPMALALPESRLPPMTLPSELMMRIP